MTKPKRNRIDVDPAWSPDGRTIAFARQDHGPQTIYLTRPDGSATHRLTLGRSPSWSPDGKKLAFVRGAPSTASASTGRAARASSVDWFIHSCGGRPTDAGSSIRPATTWASTHGSWTSTALTGDASFTTNQSRGLRGDLEADRSHNGSSVVGDRSTLIRYFAARHRRGEQLRLVFMSRGGNSNGYFNFGFHIHRQARDLQRAGVFEGKGAAICSNAGAQLAVWSVGPRVATS